MESGSGPSVTDATFVPTWPALGVRPPSSAARPSPLPTVVTSLQIRSAASMALFDALPATLGRVVHPPGIVFVGRR
jgi:hypothetical protein